MITDIASYLRFFESFRQRTERDVAALPAAAAAWRPPAIDGEAGWSIGQIVAHLGGTRLYRVAVGDAGDGSGRPALVAAMARYLGAWRSPAMTVGPDRPRARART